MDVHGTKLARTLFTIATGVERGAAYYLTLEQQRKGCPWNNFSSTDGFLSGVTRVQRPLDGALDLSGSTAVN